MTTNDPRPEKSPGSNGSSIDATARMGAADKQLKIASEHTDCEWQAAALAELRGDLAEIADDRFRTATERGKPEPGAQEGSGGRSGDSA